MGRNDTSWVEFLPRSHTVVLTEALNDYIIEMDTAIQLRRTRVEKDEAHWKQYIAMQLRDDIKRNTAQ